MIPPRITFHYDHGCSCRSGSPGSPPRIPRVREGHHRQDITSGLGTASGKSLWVRPAVDDTQ